MGITLFMFFFIISISGILLTWKKNSFDYISPENKQGTSKNFQEWLTLENLHTISNNILKDSINSNISLKLDKIEVRKKHGIVKFVYQQDYWGIQLVGATGMLLSLKKRNADFIENIHDGSILDNYFNTNGTIKLIYSTITGLALFLFSASGFWLWYGPKQMRKNLYIFCNLLLI